MHKTHNIYSVLLVELTSLLGCGESSAEKDNAIARKHVEKWLEAGLANQIKAIDHYDKALDKMEEGEHSIAIFHLNQAIRLDPQLDIAYMTRGKIRLLSENKEEAMLDFNKAINANPENIKAYLLRVMLRRDQGHYESAIRDYDLMIELVTRQINYYFSLGLIYQMCGNWAEATELYRTAIHPDVNLSYLYCNRGILWQELEEQEKALNDLTFAIQFDPEEPVFYEARGSYWFFHEENQLAISDLDKSIKLDPESDVAYSYRGDSHLALGNDDEAVKDYKQSLRLHPDNPSTCEVLAWILATSPTESLRDGELAVELAKKAVKLLEEPNWEFTDTLAAALAEQGDFKQAVVWQQKAKQQAPQDKQAGCDKRLKLYQASKPYRTEPTSN